MSSKSSQFEPLTIEAPSWVAAVMSQWEIQNLEGKLLTIIDAAIPSEKQGKATKNLVSQTLWSYMASLQKVASTMSEDGLTYKHREDKNWDGPPPSFNELIN